ncbi:hypothetical protein ScalyP_jg10378 [Parmales sp. scaly parma]|nr:hypothetical protein ScalyP_jg10378 [Parmales sp. scaly parma]
MPISSPPLQPPLTKKQLVNLYPLETDRQLVTRIQKLLNSRFLSTPPTATATATSPKSSDYKRSSLLVHEGKYLVNGGWEKRPSLAKSISVDATPPNTINFTTEILAAASQLGPSPPPPLPPGVLDLSSLEFISLDSRYTAFRDDGISCRPHPTKVGQTQLVISIVDVSALHEPEKLAKFPHLKILNECARVRTESVYIKGKNSLLLPPTALKTLCLSETGENICVSVIVTIDEGTGRIVEADVRRTRQGKLKGLVHGEEKAASNKTVQVARNLLGKWREWRVDNKVAMKRKKDGGTLDVVDNALNLYSVVVNNALKSGGWGVPRMPGTRRVGTAPLRRYVDGLVQWQVIAALLGDQNKNTNAKPMRFKEMEGILSEIVGRRNEISSFNDVKKKR